MKMIIRSFRNVSAVISLIIFAASPIRASNLTVDKLVVNSNATVASSVQINALNYLVSPALSIRQGNSPTFGYDFSLDSVTTGNMYLWGLNNVPCGGTNIIMTISRVGGNFGIGITTTPSERLYVAGSTIVTNILTAGGICLGGVTNNSWAKVITNNQASAVTLASNLTVSGRMGIGTTTPRSPLEINAINNSEHLRMSLLTDGAYYNSLLNGWNGGDVAFDYMAFKVSNGANSQKEVMRLVGNGNVGIGTDNPAAKLEVNTGGGGLGQDGVYIYHSANSGSSVLKAKSNWGDASGGDLFSVGNASGQSILIDNTRRLLLGNTTTAPYANPATVLYALAGWVGTNAGNYLYPYEFQYSVNNRQRLQFAPYRRVAGSNWPGSGWRIQTAVDNSFTDGSQTYIEMGGCDPSVSGGSFISLGVSGTDRLSINNSGNVGIGTTTPNQKLTVKGGIGFDWNAADKKLYSPADGDLEWFTHTGAAVHGFAVSHQGTKKVYLNVEGNSYLSGGNLGVGTTAPTALLQSQKELTSSDGSAGQLYLSLPTGVDGVTGFSELAFGGRRAVTGAHPIFLMRAKYNNNSTWADRSLSIIGQDYAGATQNVLLTIKDSGNVGVGTSTPAEKLHVVGNALVTSNLMVAGSVASSNIVISSSAYPQLQVVSSGHAIQNLIGVAGNEISLTFVQQSSNQWKIGMDNGPSGTVSDFAVKRFNNGNSDLMILQSNGYVGIGTNTPAEKLHVAGNALVAGNLTVNGTFFGNGSNLLGITAMKVGAVSTNNVTSIIYSNAAAFYPMSGNVSNWIVMSQAAALTNGLIRTNHSGNLNFAGSVTVTNVLSAGAISLGGVTNSSWPVSGISNIVVNGATGILAGAFATISVSDNLAWTNKVDPAALGTAAYSDASEFASKAQLDVAITNGATAVNLSGNFSGSGSGLADVNASLLNGVAASNFVQQGSLVTSLRFLPQGDLSMGSFTNGPSQ